MRRRRLLRVRDRRRSPRELPRPSIAWASDSSPSWFPTRGDRRPPLGVDGDGADDSRIEATESDPGFTLSLGGPDVGGPDVGGPDVGGSDAGGADPEGRDGGGPNAGGPGAFGAPMRSSRSLSPSSCDDALRRSRRGGPGSPLYGSLPVMADHPTDGYIGIIIMTGGPRRGTESETRMVMHLSNNDDCLN